MVENRYYFYHIIWNCKCKQLPDVNVTNFLTQKITHLASRNLDRKTSTASHVLCFSCSSICVNLRWTMLTIRSISFGATGRVLLCSRSRFTTCVVNSLHACKKQKLTNTLNTDYKAIRTALGLRQLALDKCRVNIQLFCQCTTGLVQSSTHCFQQLSRAKKHQIPVFLGGSKTHFRNFPDAIFALITVLDKMFTMLSIKNTFTCCFKPHFSRQNSTTAISHFLVLFPGFTKIKAFSRNFQARKF